MYIVDQQPIAASPMPGLDHATLAGSEQGLRALSVWRQRIAAGGATPPHRHDCEEVVLCEAGSGALLIGGLRHPFEAGQTIVIPINAEHQVINDGAAPMTMLAIFSASPVEAYLPDGRFIDLPWKS